MILEMGASIVAVLAVVHFVLTRPGKLRHKTLRDVRRALLVIAHPDDECMFFAPTLLSMTNRHGSYAEKDQCDVYLLCLSSGNHDNQGVVRKRELNVSCDMLGIPSSHVKMIEHTRLPDSPSMMWNKSLLRSLIIKEIETLGIDTVLTFDSYGVSGHPNHKAIHNAIQNAYTKGKLPVGTQVFVLQSVNLLRKYVGLLDTAISYFDATAYMYASNIPSVYRAQRAMTCYQSQMVWFRWLYILFSRYMIINTWRRISATY